MEEKKQFELVEIIKKVSPVAWRHVNLSGRFQFNTKRLTPNIGNIICALEAKVTDFIN
jgi:hypothetical protein